jgi:hypothetical protein
MSPFKHAQALADTDATRTLNHQGELEFLKCIRR